MKQFILALIVITAILTVGCERTDKEDLMLYCGAGLRPPAAELIETFERKYNVKIATDYAGSEVLMSKIRLLGHGDLYMPGDKYYVDQAANEGLILSRQSVSYWVPTILVRKGNPKNIHSLQDLLEDGVKVGLGDATACAIGRISQQILTKNNISMDDMKDNLKFQSLTVNELGMQIQAGSLDAVIVWDAMARYYSRHGEQIAIPPEKNVVSTVDIGILKFTKNRQLAEKFMEFLISEQGREIFKKHKYTVDPAG
jgi:molybdate transport system substrate-binding protein